MLINNNFTNGQVNYLTTVLYIDLLNKLSVPCFHELILLLDIVQTNNALTHRHIPGQSTLV